MNKEKEINIIGGGFAGVEAAWQASKRGIKSNLFEMRPNKTTFAHHTNDLAELVCSNSFGAVGTNSASSLIKEELRTLDSIILSGAEKFRVPAGMALAVDREQFADYITKQVESNPLINLVREEVTSIDIEKPTIIATGPLTSTPLSNELKKLTGEEHFYFFDAAAPILEAESINMDIAYRQSRYDDGEGDYINCPMTKEQYTIFWEALSTAEVAPVKNFDKYEENKNFFESCVPIEVLAKRGINTPRFGPLKPIGLRDPRVGKGAYAVVQLRQDNAVASLYNIVGFQTQLKWGEQKKVIKLIPGLENVEIVRYGVMHRNSFLNSPKLLNPTMQLRNHSNVFIAGLLTGVEGYIESCAMGALAGINLSRYLNGQEMVTFPNTTMMGALSRYISNSEHKKNFQPINSNWGIIEPFPERIRDKKLRKTKYLERGVEEFKKSVSEFKVLP